MSEIKQERANELFQEVLDSLHFSLEYDERYGGYLVYDNEANEYRGEESYNHPDAENAAVAVCHTPMDVMEELDGYVASSFVDDMTDELESYGLKKQTDVPQTIGDIVAMAQEWENASENSVEGRFYKDHAEEIAMMDLIANHIGEVDLDAMYRSDTQKEIMHFLSDADKMRDFKELTKEEFLQSYSYLTKEEYDATTREVAQRIADFYDKCTDEPALPTVDLVLEEMEKNGVPATLVQYVEDVADWLDSFEGELSKKETQAAEELIDLLDKEPKAAGLTKFELYEDLTNVRDSMMFNSYTDIAKLTTPEGKEMTLEVRGEVRVTTHDENGDIIATYRGYSDMPADLKAKIADGSYLEDESIYVGDNNWFEVFYNDANLCECVDVENCTPAEIYELMADMIEQYEMRDILPPTLEVYSITANGQYVQEDNSLGDESTRSIFYDRNEAESTLEMLNDTREECFTLLTETARGIQYTNLAEAQQEVKEQAEIAGAAVFEIRNEYSTDEFPFEKEHLSIAFLETKSDEGTTQYAELIYSNDDDSKGLMIFGEFVPSHLQIADREGEIIAPPYLENVLLKDEDVLGKGAEEIYTMMSEFFDKYAEITLPTDMTAFLEQNGKVVNFPANEKRKLTEKEENPKKKAEIERD